jgi:hypothetical protein
MLLPVVLPLLLATDGDTCPHVAEKDTFTVDVGKLPFVLTIKPSDELAADEMLDGEAVKLFSVITGEPTVIVALLVALPAVAVKVTAPLHNVPVALVAL